MRKGVKSYTVAVLLFVFLCSTILFSLSYAGSKLGKTVYAAGSDLIVGENGMTVTGNYKASKAEMGYDDNRTGVLLKTNTAGAIAKIQPQLSGAFYLDYRMLSHGDMRDINQLSFIFTDVTTGRYFEVRLICQSGPGWYNTKVFVDGDGTGYGVRSDNGEASAVSTQGTYGQASFSSREANNTNTGATADSPIGVKHTTGKVGNQLLFSPDTMEVRVNSTGSRNSLKLVMDLDSEEHMEKVGEPMLPFQKYTVQVKVTEFLSAENDSTAAANGAAGSEKRPGKVLLYSLNGQGLGGSKFTDNAGAVLNIPSSKGVVGQPYSIKEISGYDVIDGAVGYSEGKFEVYDKDNQKITLTNGTFIPTTAGKYYIEYKDTSSNASVKNFTYGDLENKFYAMRIEEIVMQGQPLRKFSARAIITILDSGEGVEFSGYDKLSDYISGYPDKKMPVGKEITVPIVIAKNNMSVAEDEHGWQVGSSKCSVSVKVTNGSKVVLEKDDYTVADSIVLESGSYVIKYIAKNQFGVVGEISAMTFTASSDVPHIKVPETLQSYIEINGRYIVPTATATASGKTIPVITSIKSPKGKEEHNVTEAYTFSELGTYTVTYTVTHNAIVYTETREIFVATKAENLFTNIRASKLEFGVDSPNYAERKNGVVVTATRGNAAIGYNNIIDLSQSAQNDTLLQFLMLPSVRGEFDFSVLRVKLYDAYNSDNYIEIAIRRNRSPQYKYTSFISAATNGNTLRGLNVNGELKDYSQQTSVCPSGFYGYGFAIGDTLEEGIETLFGNLHYDNDTKQIWVTKGREGSARSLVLDLDSTDHVGAGNEWEGFTTGEVYMTIQAEDLSKSQASYMISMINNQSLLGEYIKSDTESRIIIDMAGNAVPPVGIAGKPYKIFDAYAYNQVDGRLECGHDVQFNGSSYPTSNGAFTPNVKGIYKIIYTLNNVTREVEIEVLDVGEVDPLAFRFKDGNQITNRANVGEYVFIPTDGIISGGSGNKKVTYSVTYEGENIAIDASGKFQVRGSGKYTLTVSLTDYLGQTATFTYDITTTYSLDPIFETKANIPNIILSGKNYDFSGFIATQYIAGQSAHKAVIKISVVAGGKETVIDGGKYTPTAELAGESIVLKVEALRKDGTASEAVLNYNINVVNPYDGLQVDKSKFFFTDSDSAQIAADANKLNFKVTEDTAYSYATMLPAQKFEMDFMISSGKADFKSMQIILRDSVNSSIEIRFIIEKNTASNSYVYINNDERRGIIGGSFGTSVDADGDIGFKFRYSDGGRVVVSDSGKTIAKIPTTYQGESFEGFTSGKVYLEIKFVGVTGNSEIYLTDICGQTFNSQTIDRRSPTVQIYGILPRDPLINQTITIPRADAIDALDPNAVITLTVTAPDKTVLLNAVDISASKSIKVTQYGSYEIAYVAKDASGRTTRFTKVITVYDLIAPEIILSGAVAAEAKVGEISLPSAVATDNNGSVTLTVAVIMPNGKMVTVKDYKFNANIEGKYTVIYMAKDPSYSYCMKTFDISVKGA